MVATGIPIPDARAADEPSKPSVAVVSRCRVRYGCRCALAAVVWQVWVGRPGAALLLLAAAAPLLLLPRRGGLGWLQAALAPVLGLVGLAGVFPAVRGQASRMADARRTRRARLLVADPGRAAAGTGTSGWASSPGTPARAVWEGSLSSAAMHVVGPTLSLGVLLGAALWAAGCGAAAVDRAWP